MKNKIGRQKQSTRKGRYFIYAETEFYASRRSCSGIGHLQILCLQGNHELNEELQEKGYLTISGRVNREFFREKYYYTKTAKEES